MKINICFKPLKSQTLFEEKVAHRIIRGVTESRKPLINISTSKIILLHTQALFNRNSAV